MRNLIVLFLVCCCAVSVFAQNADKPVVEKSKHCDCFTPNEAFTAGDYAVYSVVFYPVNRINDFCDIITWSASAGLEEGVFVRATNYMQFGGAFGHTYFISNVTKRTYPADQAELIKYLMNYLPYGAGHYAGWNYGFLCFSAEKSFVLDSIGAVEQYEHVSDFGIPSFNDKIYKDKIRDFWAIEARVAYLWGLEISVHPVEIADFVLGIFCIDIKSDDI